MCSIAFYISIVLVFDIIMYISYAPTCYPSLPNMQPTPPPLHETHPLTLVVAESAAEGGPVPLLLREYSEGVARTDVCHRGIQYKVFEVNPGVERRVITHQCLMAAIMYLLNRQSDALKQDKFKKLVLNTKINKISAKEHYFAFKYLYYWAWMNTFRRSTIK